MKQIRSKVNLLCNFAQRLRTARACYSNGRYDISALMRLFSIHLATRLVITVGDDGVFLLVYQRDQDYPDYTIKLKERHE